MKRTDRMGILSGSMKTWKHIQQLNQHVVQKVEMCVLLPGSQHNPVVSLVGLVWTDIPEPTIAFRVMRASASARELGACSYSKVFFDLSRTRMSVGAGTGSKGP
jgi:hypothetical protein